MGPSVLFHGEQTKPRHPARISDDHLAAMKVFKDLISGDEMFTDTYRFEDVDDAFSMVVAKNITISDDNIELAGANPSAEEADEGTETNTTSGIDVVLYMRLVETAFGTKKEYFKTLKAKMEETGEASNASKLPNMQKPITT